MKHKLETILLRWGLWEFQTLLLDSTIHSLIGLKIFFKYTMGNSNSSVAEEPSESAVANETIPAAEGASPVQRTDGHDMNIAINLDDIFSQPEHAEGSNRNLYGHNPSLGQVTANEDNEVIHLSKLPKSVSTQLQFLDRDGDGTIDIEEIRRLIASNERNKSEVKIKQ